MSSSNNILKRKNDDPDTETDDQLNKRVALDSEQLTWSEKQQEEAQTAPKIVNGANEVKEEQENQVSSEVQTENNEEHDDINQAGADSASKPISNHREKENDPSYVALRMFCPVREASTVVGKKGEKINHIREKANVRINVSENLKNVPERIILVRGPAENVARSFGLIARTILEEPEDEPASMLSKPYNLKLLIPHPMVGYIIGKQGSKFREIEENSAAKLKAAEQPLPYCTDRILTVTGVGDAIHIAVYYISQVIIEHKDCLKKNKVVYYNPANFHQNNMNNNMMNVSMIPSNTNMLMMNNNPFPMQSVTPLNDAQTTASPYVQQAKQPYDFLMMFQPTTYPQQQYGTPAASTVSYPSQNQYTDEHGNIMIGEVIINPPVQVGTGSDKFNEDVYVANANIGSVIGKGGNNIKQIRENSGCSYVKIEPDQRQSLMLGGGKGLTNIRKLTLTGNLQSIQMAIYLINQRIGADKERNSI